MTNVDDWYRDIEETPEDKRRDAILALIREALDTADRGRRPIRLRNLTVNFDARTVSVDGRVYGPIETSAFTIPLLDGTHAVMPSRTNEPW